MVLEYGNSNTIEATVSSNQMYLVDLHAIVSDADSCDDVMDATTGIWSWIYEEMDDVDTVLDPFSGSGTTATSALGLGRRCIGFELNKDFEPVTEDRLSSLRQRSLTEFKK